MTDDEKLEHLLQRVKALFQKLQSRITQLEATFQGPGVPISTAKAFRDVRLAMTNVLDGHEQPIAVRRAVRQLANVLHADEPPVEDKRNVATVSADIATLSEKLDVLLGMHPQLADRARIMDEARREVMPMELCEESPERRSGKI